MISLLLGFGKKQKSKTMHKLAIFVEGQTEQIFIKQLLYQIFGYQSIRVADEKVIGRNIFIQLQDDAQEDHLKYLFLLVNVGNDEKVASAMLENASNMVSKGFKKILGLRDLYPHRREQETSIRNAINKVIQKSPESEKLKIFLAIMETEAWFLADTNLFEKIDKRLTQEYIREQLRYDLEQEDPESTLNHPAKIINDIYSLVDLSYKKRQGDCYKIAHNIDYDYLYLDVREQNKISSFFQFADELTLI